MLNLGSLEAIEIHFEAIQSSTTETDSLKCSLEALKISAMVDFTQMGAWSYEVDLQLKMKAEGQVGRIRRWLEDTKLQEEITAREDQISLKSHKGRIRLQANLMQDNQGEASPKQRQVRPPKIDIETFEGWFINWPQSRGQFTEPIDKLNIAPINKFTYLCGLER